MFAKEAIESDQAGTPASWLQECFISLSPSNNPGYSKKMTKQEFFRGGGGGAVSQGFGVISKTKKSLRMVPANTEIFLQRLWVWGKADLSNRYWNLKRKMWVTRHVSEIIKQP